MIKLIRYHLPPIVKHVLAPQNDFGMPKITWSNHKSFGIEENPPPRMGKTPKKYRIFFWEAPLAPSGALYVVMNPKNSRRSSSNAIYLIFDSAKCHSVIIKRQSVPTDQHILVLSVKRQIQKTHTAEKSARSIPAGGGYTIQYDQVPQLKPSMPWLDHIVHLGRMPFLSL